MEETLVRVVLISLLAWSASSRDVTREVFGNAKDILPAAFGDFNSDEVTDLFALVNGGRTVEILLGSLESEPFFKASNLTCTFKECRVRSVVPGDFNGDAFMDALVVTRCRGDRENLLGNHVLWGGQVYLKCSFDEDRPLFRTEGEPLAMDYNNDFVIDLFGVDENRNRGFWVFDFAGNFTFVPLKYDLPHDIHPNPIRVPHSNAFLDLNNDNIADLFITSKNDENDQFEVWKGTGDKWSFHTIIRPPLDSRHRLGQSTFLDLELEGKLDHLVPYLDKSDPKIYVYSEKSWHDLNVDFKDPKGVLWHFFDADELPFAKAITLRGGDYNMDGYPDFLATLASPGKTSRTFLFENTPCKNCDNFTRTFRIQWDSFYPEMNDSVMGVFYDIFQDGILDVLVVARSPDGSYRAKAFKNNLDYDANFVRVMVLTGLSNKNATSIVGPLRKRKQTFGTNLPGPRISYKTVDQEGYVRIGVSSQIPQSAHYALYLPYIMFALGRTPNFVENITVGFASRYREWPQIIPNSQMVVIPHPIENEAKWKVQLFVTPSKVIYVSVAALAGTCVVILVIISLLHWKEMRMDRKERLQEAYRFHFDAM